MDERFGRARRITSSRHIQALLRTGSRVRRGTLQVVWTRCDNETAQFGVIISRRVGHAVQRNRLRRRLRELWRRARPTWPTPVRLIVRAFPGAAELDWAELQAEFLELAATVQHGCEPRNARPPLRTDQTR